MLPKDMHEHVKLRNTFLAVLIYILSMGLLVTAYGRILEGWFQQYYEEADRNGYAKIPMFWRDDSILSKKWFDDIRDSNPMDSLSKYQGAILAVSGTEDELVPSIHAKEIVSACHGEISEYRIIDNANHTFNVLEKDNSAADKVIKDTADWISVNFNKYKE